ncbi:molybdopterin-dependent oxidoreductase [Nonomuraea sp. NPDC050547]|uniref:molybdopterin-dependent oxidoreductase n=1 Tax=Nonomuraea sp. NPDC050547 TaxID=3364368 RepID=UPI00379DF520
MDVSLADGVRVRDVERWVPSASLLHSNGDAMDIAVRDERIVGVRGRAADRVNRGRLDPKDRYGWQANHHQDRLVRPLVDGRETGWDEALDLIAARSRKRLPHQIGFYTSGQLFLEESYTLAVIGKAGLRTPHMDGNTRLCTATSAAALKANFGTDGQPGSYEDVDHCDTLALWGHNAAETQIVLWERMLDRRRGADAPMMIAVDPRDTAVAAEADVHLAVRPGTNLALMNALLHQIIAKGWHEPDYIDAHTVGFDRLCRVVEPCTPAWAAGVCGVPAVLIERAAEILGSARNLFSTVLQGFYQSHQATAAACQVNNLHLVRGMLGRTGAGLCQMNGQPTAQNTRETGADGDPPGFRNWANPAHVEDLARRWNVDPATIPHSGPPTPALEIFQLAEQGEITMLWIVATNPAVSLPDLARVRRVLAKPDLFVVVQDAGLAPCPHPRLAVSS